MKRQALFGISMVMLAGVTCLAAAGVAGAVAQDGLESVQSRFLDEVYLRPSADWVGYRKVLIDPAQVTMRQNWRKDQNATRDVSRWISPSDVDEILAVATASMDQMVKDAFLAKGYEIVTAPGPGVMRLTPTVVDLDVYEPDVTFSRPSALFTHDEAGKATLHLEARDSQSGVLLGVVNDRGTATTVSRMNRATKTSNQLWFDALFRQWTANVIVAIQSAQPK
jgi:hypothetical protein